jgi:DNA repair exonuclease SbcCD ATPase subunit
MDDYSNAIKMATESVAKLGDVMNGLMNGMKKDRQAARESERKMKEAEANIQRVQSELERAERERTEIARQMEQKRKEMDEISRRGRETQERLRISNILLLVKDEDRKRGSIECEQSMTRRNEFGVC